MNITADQIKQILSHNPNAADWLLALNTVLPQYEINTADRIAAFLAQTAHESADYTHLSENLNYGAEGLIKTWPNRFNAENASKYARQPIKIANKVYSLRMGNSNEESGDGWKYRGRGLIQMTGKTNYGVCSKALFGDIRLLETPELVATDKEVALKSACWFWSTNGLNVFADNHRMNEMTKKINGGFTGLELRIAKFNSAIKILRS